MIERTRATGGATREADPQQVARCPISRWDRRSMIPGGGPSLSTSALSAARASAARALDFFDFLPPLLVLGHIFQQQHKQLPSSSSPTCRSTAHLPFNNQLLRTFSTWNCLQVLLQGTLAPAQAAPLAPHRIHPHQHTPPSLQPLQTPSSLISRSMTFTILTNT